MEKQPEPRIYAVVPYTEAEKDRYIQSVMHHLWSFCDVVSFWPDSDGQMLEDEGNWRRLMLVHTQDNYWRSARSGIDWILVNDADEYVVNVHNMHNMREALLNPVLQYANDQGYDSLTFGLDELWQLDPPKIRTDKTWSGQKMQRMFRYNEAMQNIFYGSLACGSIPEWARNNSYHVPELFRVLHAGYAYAPERQGKFDRYNGRPGHGSAHIQSILDTEVTLEDVPYECPAIWRGSERERTVQS